MAILKMLAQYLKLHIGYFLTHHSHISTDDQGSGNKIPIHKPEHDNLSQARWQLTNLDTRLLSTVE
jgi:hypothetical protein